MNDETRHMELVHVARSSYSALELVSLANFQDKRHTLIRVRAGVLSGFPSSSVCRRLVLERRVRDNAPYHFAAVAGRPPYQTVATSCAPPVRVNRGCGLGLGGARGARALPKLRPGGGSLLHPPMSKITFPLVQPHPFSRKDKPSPLQGTMHQLEM